MNIIWSNFALSEYDEAIAYLLDQWSINIAQRFIEDMDKTLDKVKDHPNMFKASESYQYLRKAKVNKLKSIIYQVDGNDIVIFRVLDNRSDHNY